MRTLAREAVLPQQMEERKKSWEEEEENKKQQQAARAGKKVEKGQREDKWRAMKETHEKMIEGWIVECERLTANGTLKRDLPKRPARPLKPKPAGAVATSSQVRLEDLDQQSELDEGGDLGGHNDEFDLQ